MEFSKIPRFLGGFKRGLYFSWFIFEKSCSNLVNQHFFLGEKYWLTQDWSGGFVISFHSTSKADFGDLKIPCVLKIFSKQRRIKNSPATGVKFGIPVGWFLHCTVLLKFPRDVLILVSESLLCSGSCPFSSQHTRFFEKSADCRTINASIDVRGPWEIFSECFALSWARDHARKTLQ